MTSHRPSNPAVLASAREYIEELRKENARRRLQAKQLAAENDQLKAKIAELQRAAGLAFGEGRP